MFVTLLSKELIPVSFTDWQVVLCVRFVTICQICLICDTDTDLPYLLGKNADTFYSSYYL